MKEVVWKFTNQQELDSAGFVRYFEKKVRKTVGKYHMPTSPLKKGGLKAEVINSLLKNIPLREGGVSDVSLDDVSVAVLYEVMYGVFKVEKFLPKNQPLYFLSDKEIELYAKIKGIKGKLKKRSGKLGEVDDFIKKIELKNPDIRHNIINSLLNQKI